jgi:hypothetical protein
MSDIPRKVLEDETLCPKRPGLPGPCRRQLGIARCEFCDRELPLSHPTMITPPPLQAIAAAFQSGEAAFQLTQIAALGWRLELSPLDGMDPKRGFRGLLESPTGTRYIAAERDTMSELVSHLVQLWRAGETGVRNASASFGRYPPSFEAPRPLSAFLPPERPWCEFHGLAVYGCRRCDAARARYAAAYPDEPLPDQR